MLKILQKVIELDESESPLGRHTVLLGSLVLLLMALPLNPYIPTWLPIYPILLALVLIATVIVNKSRIWVMRVAAAFGCFAIVGGIHAELTDSLLMRTAADLAGMALLGFTTLFMGTGLVRAKQVDADTVIGGICVYLMIGIWFAMLLILMAEFDPQAFQRAGQAVADVGAHADRPAKDLVYFSFVTLTTLGYGDVTPISDFAQMVSVFEALIGQLYLTVFLARLVALFVSRGISVPR